MYVKQEKEESEPEDEARDQDVMQSTQIFVSFLTDFLSLTPPPLHFDSDNLISDQLRQEGCTALNLTSSYYSEPELTFV